MIGQISSSRFKLKGESSRRPKLMAEINVTPFVDVMLVLLVVFMVTAPLLTVGVPLNLPQTKAKTLPGSDEPLSVSVDADGRIWVMDTEVELRALTPLLIEISGENKLARIFVRGDKEINYGRVLEVMGAITGAGFGQVSLVSRSPNPQQNNENETSRD